MLHPVATKATTSLKNASTGYEVVGGRHLAATKSCNRLGGKLQRASKKASNRERLANNGERRRRSCMARGAATGTRRAMMADCDNAGTLTRRCCNQREGDTPGPTELHTANAPGELRRRAAPASCDGELRRRAASVSCDAASKGEHEEADPRRSVFFPVFTRACGRKKKPGAIRFFFLDPTTRAAHIQRPGLDRPKLSAGAPAPISAHR